MLQCGGGDGGGACDDAVFLDDAGAVAAYGCASTDEPLSRSATCDDKQALDEQQKYADEHLFLRYLELDPTEGPDATCAATQRTAAAAAGGGATPRQGRTPFTHTKRLVRSRPSGGFGFSVVWTRPPRVERVERGGAADRAGLLPGDYIIFVDRFNVVTMPEMEVLSLIRSCGNQLTLEIFRRPGGGGGITSRNGSLPTANKRLSASCAPLSRPSTAAPPTRRPSTVCSTTAHTTVTEYGGAGSQRRRLHLATTPQAVAFCTEKSNNPEENRRKAMYQLISKEQQYATHLQFAISRFVSALNERKDLITPAEHRVLFQNCDEILRITEDILDNLIHEDGEPQIHLLVRTYHMKLHEITTAYRKYCSGIKKADCILANKTKNTNSEFSRFLQVPQIPRRRPDITAFIHKPLEHYREMLRLLITIQGNTKSNHEDFPVINKVVHDLQLTYREITAGSGLMEPVGEGRPLLTVQDLENRLVFTKCKPFVLNKPGRQWIFGGDLTRVEGRNVRQCWALLFSDLLLFAKASRDRVLFVIEEPLPLSHVSDVIFNVRKKDTEFRLTINPEGKKASSPTVHCGPDLTRTPRKGAGRKTVLALRAPTPELKAVWQTLLQKQIYQATCNTDGSSPNSPLESPEVPITSSVATLHSAESLSVVRRQTPQPPPYPASDAQKQLDLIIEHKCKQLRRSSNCNNRYNAIHLERWMKGQLESEQPPDVSEVDSIEEEWTEEQLRKRSEELQLIDKEGNVTCKEINRGESRCEEEIILSDHSPSKSTTTESQVTVRSSPQFPETVPVCRQCHKNCLSNNGSIKNYNDCNSNKTSPKLENSGSCRKATNDKDWQPLIHLGITTSSYVSIDPFSIPLIPKIAVLPATPENSTRTASSENDRDESNQCQNVNCNQNTSCGRVPIKLEYSCELDNSPDDSPQTEEHPYHSLSSSVATLRRFGTVSSLERVGSEEREEDNVLEDGTRDQEDEDDEDEDEDEEEDDDEGGVDNEAFYQTSIRHWTIRAGSFVAEKMAFFEKLGEDYRAGGLFDRYLKSSDNPLNGEDQQEEETSGGTSGEEIWGTPTSGEMDDNLSPYEDRQSPNEGSLNSDYADDTELMMDELLMTPPITGAVMRGLLPRRTLEPLIEEEGGETSSSSDGSTTEPSGNNSEQVGQVTHHWRCC
ncbi:unnamed protein product [Callosobruchus maculatus]|nr:unnamed protein product [Callosobruchus maculatus]